jgi:hypothetical protein
VTDEDRFLLKLGTLCLALLVTIMALGFMFLSPR